MTEPSTGSGLKQIKLTARRDGDNYVLIGTKVFITQGVPHRAVLAGLAPQPIGEGTNETLRRIVARGLLDPR